LLVAALVATVLASEDAFLDFTKQFGKRYTKAAEMIKRRYAGVCTVHFLRCCLDYASFRWLPNDKYTGH
jgi:hypothetical protein